MTLQDKEDGTALVRGSDTVHLAVRVNDYVWLNCIDDAPIGRDFQGDGSRYLAGLMPRKIMCGECLGDKV